MRDDESIPRYLFDPKETLCSVAVIAINVGSTVGPGWDLLAPN